MIPMAIPTSASCRAGASLTPSPVIATNSEVNACENRQTDRQTENIMRNELHTLDYIVLCKLKQSKEDLENRVENVPYKIRLTRNTSISTVTYQFSLIH